VHRDLKCQNIFLTAKSECKIGDFGISKIMEETFDLAKTKIGTPFCMAPEIWESMPYNQKSDIWSLGCILYELCTLKNPFQASSNFLYDVDAGSYLIKITQGKYDPIKGNYSEDLKELVAELLNKEPQHRPSVHKIL
jgi:serine/threonine protein kinase